MFEKANFKYCNKKEYLSQRCWIERRGQNDDKSQASISDVKGKARRYYSLYFEYDKTMHWEGSNFILLFTNNPVFNFNETNFYFSTKNRIGI